MTTSSPKSVFWRGVRDGAPFTLIVMPFAIVFSVLAIDEGLSVGQTIAFSVLVIAGAAQFAALHLMATGAPAVIVVVTALAVNLRMAMYSAALVPHIGSAPLWQRAIVAYLNVDQSFAQSMVLYQAEPDMPVAQKVAYFVGLAAPVAVVWYLSAAAGAVAGQWLPEDLTLDFAVPVAFTAIVALMLRTTAHWAAAGVSVVLALALHGLPYNSGLLIAGAAAMVTGALVEARMEAAG